MDDTKATTRINLANAALGAGAGTAETAPTLHTEELLVPRHCTLDGFAEEATRQGGVDVGGLDPLCRLTIRTQNTNYRVFVLSPSESKVLIQGGRFFAEPAVAYLCGSSYGGNLLKVAWIGVGMRIEVMRHGRRIVTSPVQSVAVMDDADIPGPF